MHAIQLVDGEKSEPRLAHDGTGAATRMVTVRRQAVADAVAPLRAEAARLADEMAGLGEAARRKLWEAIVQTREIHGRICDAAGRLEHLQLDIREQTGEVRLPSIPVPFVDFLLDEMRRFAITVATPDAR